MHYEGQLLAARGDPRDGQVDRRASHKHAIRQAFHGQLKHLWQTRRWLSEATMPWSMFDVQRGDPTREGDYYEDKKPLAEGLAKLHRVGDFGFVPLVCEQFKVLCGVKLLLLRRDTPGGILDARDLDNRLKIIFDALRMPRALNEFSVEGTPDPMFVLLQDDSLISSVQIETDTLLDPPEIAARDDSYVRLLVEVDIRPYYASMFSLSFVAD
jgi:hypothetical protein